MTAEALAAPAQTAVDAYAAAVAEAEQTLAAMTERLAGLRSPDAPVHWGHVGSAVELNRLLKAAQRFA